jgi:hypothetical protein
MAAESMPRLEHLPRAGDVVFFRESFEVPRKTLHAFISFGQRLHGVKNPDLVHAAILVSPFELADARMKEGVSASKVTNRISRLPATDYVVLRRSRPLFGEADRATQERLVQAAYYFYREAYDWHGLGRALSLRDVRVGSSICSVFVKKVLIRSGEVSAENWSEYPEHIFPGELFELLKHQGYQELPFITPFDSKFETPGLLATMDEGRNNFAQITDLANSMPDFSGGIRKLFEQMGDEGAALRYLSIISAFSVLDLLDRQLERIVNSSMPLEQIVRAESNWRDRERHNESVNRILRNLEEDSEDFYRLREAVSVALEPRGFRKRIQELDQLKERIESMSEEESAAFANELFSDGCHTIASTVQLTGCSSTKEWLIAASRFLRRARDTQKRLKETEAQTKVEAPDFYLQARMVTKQIQATFRFGLQMMVVPGREQAEAVCPRLIEDAQVGLENARKQFMDAGVPVDTMRELFRAAP